MNMTGVAAVLAALTMTTACGGSSDGAASAAESVTATVTTTVTPTSSPEPDPVEAPSEPSAPRLFPKGFPKVVSVASLPDQVRSSYEGTYIKAIAVAPGVWAGKAPGVTKTNVLDGGVLDGFCGSLKAYEKKFLDGQEFGGSCW